MTSTTTPDTIVAKFNPHVKKYLFASTVHVIPVVVPFLVLVKFKDEIALSFTPIILVATILTVSLLCAIGWWLCTMFYRSLSCTVTDKNVVCRKGLSVEIENTIPIENIQDVTYIEGPLLRYFGLSVIEIETSGNKSAMKLVGIVGANDLRKEILERRDQLKKNASKTEVALLTEINTKLEKIVANLK